MNKVEFENCIDEELNKFDIILSSTKKDQLYKYMIGLLEWNEKINLTAIKEHNEFVMKHYVDSLLAVKYLKDAEKIIDVGTGGGFPGIPLKIYFPDARVTLLDSVNKKLNVVRELSNNLKLENIEYVHGRVEDIGHRKEYREEFDVTISRAVANLTTLVEYLIPLTKINGKVICLKGPGVDDEIDNAQNAIKKLGGKIVKVDKMSVGDEERCIVVINKIKSSPNGYPRKAGIPLKDPIK